MFWILHEVFGFVICTFLWRYSETCQSFTDSFNLSENLISLSRAFRELYLYDPNLWSNGTGESIQSKCHTFKRWTFRCTGKDSPQNDASISSVEELPPEFGNVLSDSIPSSIAFHSLIFRDEYLKRSLQAYSPMAFLSSKSPLVQSRRRLEKGET